MVIGYTFSNLTSHLFLGGYQKQINLIEGTAITFSVS